MSGHKQVAKNPQVTVMGSLFKRAQGAAFARIPEEIKPAMGREFHALYTFALTLPFQLLYLILPLASGSDGGTFSSVIAHLHIGIIIIGGAVLRCLLGFFISGQIANEGSTYDYPEEGNLKVSLNEKTSKRQSIHGSTPLSHKSNKGSTK